MKKEPSPLWGPLAQGHPGKKCAPGQIIYLQGTPAEEFYYLLEGSARSYISSPDGAELALTVHRAGDLMGEAAFFDQGPRISSAMALTPCRVVPIGKERLAEQLQLHPELALPLLRYLAKTVRLLSQHVGSISFRPADRRLAGALLGHADGRGVVRATHEELGSAIGVSRVTASRILSRFAQTGWLERGYGHLRILNREALSAYAQAEP